VVSLERDYYRFENSGNCAIAIDVVKVPSIFLLIFYD
jgi:hypothetical protein